MTRKPIDVDSYLDNLKFGRFHIQVLLLGVIIMLVDGYEVGVIGLVLPVLADDYGVSRVSLTWVLSAQQVGMVVGAYFIAPLADRYGRKPLALASLLWVGLSCFVTIQTTSLLTLAICRLVTGIFASTLIANLVAWTAEMAPSRHRALMVTIVLTGSSAGALLGSAVQAFVIEPYGWRGAFWIGAILPLLLVPLTWLFFQESPRFIAERNPQDPRLAAFARSLGDHDVELVAPPQSKGQAAKGRIAELFRSGLAVPTLLLWLCFVLDFLFITAWFWKTTIFHDLIGLSWDQLALITSMEMVFGALGMLTVGMLVNRFGFRTMIPAYFTVAAISIVLMGVLAPTWGMFAVLAVKAAAQNAGHASLALVASNIYPTRSRATGVGWAYGAGRAASIVGPPFGAIPLQYGWSVTAYFTLLALPLILAAVAVFALLRKADLARS